MKILTGRFSGRKLSYRPHAQLRPTSDKTRMAIVNILSPCFAGASVLDLYGGTGALGLEALSMGAARVVFVEQNAAQARQITENLKALGVEGSAEVRAQEAFASLSFLSAAEKKFDLVFVDPPYGKGLAQKTLEALERGPLLNEGAIVVIECGKKEKFHETVGGFQCVKEKNYGDTRVLFFRQATLKRSC